MGASTVEEGAAWTKKEGKSKSGGLNRKGRKSYERENPRRAILRHLQRGLGTLVEKFLCENERYEEETDFFKTANDPIARINKSLRAWNC